MGYRMSIFRFSTSRQWAKGSRQKNRGLPIALCPLPTLRTGWVKIANPPITLNLTLPLAWRGLTVRSTAPLGDHGVNEGNKNHLN